MTDDEKKPEPQNSGEIELEPSEKMPPPPKPAISEPPLTEGMSEDEMESIERDEPAPKKTKRALPPDDEIPEGALGAPGRLGWRFPLIAGGAAILAAVIIAGIYPPADAPAWRAALRQLIDAPLYAWIGVGAVLATAQLTERPFGGVYFVLARMTFAVGVFALLWQLSAAIVSEQAWHNAVRWPMAAGAGAIFYALWCLFCFRLNRSEVGLLGGLHLLAWLVLWAFRQVSA